MVPSSLTPRPLSPPAPHADGGIQRQAVAAHAARRTLHLIHNAVAPAAAASASGASTPDACPGIGPNQARDMLKQHVWAVVQRFFPGFVEMDHDPKQIVLSLCIHALGPHGPTLRDALRLSASASQIMTAIESRILKEELPPLPIDSNSLRSYLYRTINALQQAQAQAPCASVSCEQQLALALDTIAGDVACQPVLGALVARALSVRHGGYAPTPVPLGTLRLAAIWTTAAGALIRVGLERGASCHEVACKAAPWVPALLDKNTEITSRTLQGYISAAMGYADLLRDCVLQRGLPPLPTATARLMAALHGEPNATRVRRLILIMDALVQASDLTPATAPEGITSWPWTPFAAAATTTTVRPSPFDGTPPMLPARTAPLPPFAATFGAHAWPWMHPRMHPRVPSGMSLPMPGPRDMHPQAPAATGS